MFKRLVTLSGFSAYVDKLTIHWHHDLLQLGCHWLVVITNEIWDVIEPGASTSQLVMIKPQTAKVVGIVISQKANLVY